VQKRCTKEEIKCNNALLQEKKDMITKKKALGIAHVAHLEDRMAIKDSGAERAHPHSTLFISTHGNIIDMKDAMESEAPDRDKLHSQKNEPKKASRKELANDKSVIQDSLRQAKEKQK